MVKYAFNISFHMGRVTFTLKEGLHGITQAHAENVIARWVAKAKANGFKFIVIYE